MSPRERAALGVDLWRCYAATWRILPAALVARAVGVSPTTMGRALAAAGIEYGARRGCRPDRGTNLRGRGDDVQDFEMPENVTLEWRWSNGNPIGIPVMMGENEEEPAEGAVADEASPAAAELKEMEEEGDGELEEGDGFDFAGAMQQAWQGYAVCRASDPERVVFVGPEVAVMVGTMDDRGDCRAFARYDPTDEDKAADDWVLDTRIVLDREVPEHLLAMG